MSKFVDPQEDYAARCVSEPQMTTNNQTIEHQIAVIAAGKCADFCNTEIISWKEYVEEFTLIIESAIKKAPTHQATKPNG
jgi:hypothetical protein